MIQVTGDEFLAAVIALFVLMAIGGRLRKKMGPKVRPVLNAAAYVFILALWTLYDIYGFPGSVTPFGATYWFMIAVVTVIFVFAVIFEFIRLESREKEEE